VLALDLHFDISPGQNQEKRKPNQSHTSPNNIKNLLRVLSFCNFVEIENKTKNMFEWKKRSFSVVEQLSK
jgi:hypothetical protein